MDTHHEEQEARESGRVALLGFGVALVWLAIVGVISFAIAGGFRAAEH